MTAAYENSNLTVASLKMNAYIVIGSAVKQGQ
jgi:hypothetical protein